MNIRERRMNMYRIPKEIQSATRLGRKVTLADVLFLGICSGLTWGFGRILVHSFYIITYWLFSALIMLHLLTSVKENAGVKRFESYLFYLVRKRGSRHALLVEKEHKYD